MDEDTIDLPSVLLHTQDSGALDLHLAEWIASDYQLHIDPAKSDAFSESLSECGQHVHSRSLDSPEISFLPDRGNGLLSPGSLEEAAGQLSLNPARLAPDPDPDLAQLQAFPQNRNFNQPSVFVPMSVFHQETDLLAKAGLEGNENQPQDSQPLPLVEKVEARCVSDDLEPNIACLDAQRTGPERYGLRIHPVACQRSMKISEDSSKTETLSSQASDSREKKRRRGSGAFGKAVSAIEHAAKGGAAAMTSLLPNRRSRDPVIIKEKAKARNRRSQKAFRKRQKDLQKEREDSMKILEQSVQTLGFQNENLRVEVEALRTSHQVFVEQHFRAPSFGDVQEMQATSKTPLRISLEKDNVRSISMSNLQNITLLELVTLWKGYVAILGDLLEGTSLPVSELGLDSSSSRASELEREKTSQMEILVVEVTRLTRSIAIFRPDLFRRFHTTNMQTMQEQKATRGHWRSVIAMIELDESQRQAILQGRRDAIAQLAQLLNQRKQLISIQRQLLEDVQQDTHFHTNNISSTHKPMFEAVNEMNNNLKAEQALITREMCSMQQSILTLPQLAQFISYSWPYYPGKLEAASVLAQKCGEPSTSLLLHSGLQTTLQFKNCQA